MAASPEISVFAADLIWEQQDAAGDPPAGSDDADDPFADDPAEDDAASAGWQAQDQDDGLQDILDLMTEDPEDGPGLPEDDDEDDPWIA